MKTIGLLGGMSRESSMEYYRIINQGIKEKLGGHHSAKLLMYSVDFAEIEKLQHVGDRDSATKILVQAAQDLQVGSAECILICTNTMHKMYDEIQAAVNIPVLHIADPTIQAIQNAGLNNIVLLGTKFTMEQEFYRGRLEQVGLTVITPDEHDRSQIHRIIYDELCMGIINPASAQIYHNIINKLIDQGAKGVILGCTEIGLLIKPGMVSVPVFDTTLIHAHKAVEYALI